MSGAHAVQPLQLLPHPRDLTAEVGHVVLQLGAPELEIGVLAGQCHAFDVVHRRTLQRISAYSAARLE